MQIEYLTTKSRREVADGIGARLIAARIARAVAVPAVQEAAPVVVVAASRIDKTKRKYKRRDMRAKA